MEIAPAILVLLMIFAILLFFDVSGSEGFSGGVIYLVRHCDKPSDARARNCSDIGYKRADLFSTEVIPHLGITPGALYAAKYASKGSKNCTKAIRTDEMLLPTSKKYNLDIQMPFCIGDTKEFAQTLTNNSKTVIIAWEHYNIAELINDLLPHMKSQFPQWPKTANDRYDLIFVIDQAAGTVHVKTMNLGLPHDSNTLPDVYRAYA